MKIKLVNQKGKSVAKQIELEPTIFEAKINDDLEVQALRIYQYNQRKWSAKTKTRSEVRGGGIKPWAQKGTGRARHGSIRSPLWVKGGVAFGPQPKDKKLRISAKMRKNAIRSAFSRKAKEDLLIVVDKIALKKEKLTKQMIDVVNSLLPKDNVHKAYKVAMIIGKVNKDIYKSASNLKKIRVLLPEAINIYELTKSDYIIFTKDGLDQITKVWKLRAPAKKGTKIL